MKFINAFQKRPILYSYLCALCITLLDLSLIFSPISLFLICTFLFHPILLTFLNIFYLFHRHPKPLTLSAGKKIEVLTIILGTFYSLLYFSLNILMIEWKDWQEPLYSFQLHTPIAKNTTPTVITIAVIAITAYFILRFVPLKKLPPLIIVICISAIYLGMALCILEIIQLYKNDLSYLLPCLFPFNCILIAAKTLKEIIRQWNKINQETEHSEKFIGKPVLNKLNNLLIRSVNWPWLALVGTLPLLCISIIILMLFGQAPDSIIKAWTETADWNLSQHIAPQNLPYDGHYLCTVAARGHKKIVKPLRLGQRHGHKVIVNRQLCIANAFEQILEEKLPRLHKLIRHIYDTYGYPIAKHIHSPLAADAVYIIMKPAEWFFLIVIYLCDVKPENRIAIQYFPLKNRRPQ